MVHYEYVGRLSDQTLLCISVAEAEDENAWMVLAQLLILSSKGNTGRIELARASYAEPLHAVEEAIALSRALEQTEQERMPGKPPIGDPRVRRALG